VRHDTEQQTMHDDGNSCNAFASTNSISEKRLEVERLRKVIEAVLVKELVENGDMTPDRIRRRIEELIDEDDENI